MDDLKLQEGINEAIVRYVQSWWSAEAERQIIEVYGAEVAEAAKQVYDNALNCLVDWRTETMNSALNGMHLYLDREYPWLCPEARTRLNYCFIMAWK